MLIQQGTIVGSYRIEGILGRGGMAAVYSATHVDYDRHVALNVLVGDSDDAYLGDFGLMRQHVQGRARGNADFTTSASGKSIVFHVAQQVTGKRPADQQRRRRSVRSRRCRNVGRAANLAALA